MAAVPTFLHEASHRNRAALRRFRFIRLGSDDHVPAWAEALVTDGALPTDEAKARCFSPVVHCGS